MDKKTRNAQVGRIHSAKTRLGMADGEYRDFLEGLTKERSCSDLSDAQVNHVLDWLMYLEGRRPQPTSFDRSGLGPHVNLVRLAYRLAKRPAPEGWSENPLASAAWRERMIGRAALRWEEYSVAELQQLVEGTKAIYARTGSRLKA